jgi:hypothetical protein
VEKDGITMNWEFWAALVMGLAAVIGITLMLATVFK